MKTTLKDILNIIFRYSQYLAIFTLAVILIAAIFGITTTKMYRSNAKILIRLGSEQSASNQLIGNMANVYITRREQELKNELEILTSDWVMTEVAREVVKTDGQRFDQDSSLWRILYRVVDRIKNFLGLTPDAEEAIAEVKSFVANNLTVSALFESDTLELFYEHPDPEVAQRILTMVIDQFIKHHIQAYTNVKELNFLSEELDVSRRNYERLLDEQGRFTNQHGVFNDKQQLDLVMEKKRDLERALAELKADYEYHTRKLDRLQDVQGTLKPYETFNTSQILNKTRENLRNKLNEARIEKQTLLTRYQEDSRFIKDINREIVQLEKLLSSEPERVIDQKDSRKNPVYESLVTDILNLDSDVAGERAKIASLEKEMVSVGEELTNFTANNKDFQLLTKDVEFAKITYEKVFDGYLDTRLRSLISKQEITNISVIEQPSLNRVPDSPNKKKLAIITLAVLVAGNIFLLVLFSVIDTAVTNPSEIPRLCGASVEGDLPFVKPSNSGEHSFLWLYQKQVRPFQSLYTNLFLKGDQDQVILIAKSRPGEGGTTISYNLAEFMAVYQGKKVALVDFTGDNAMAKDIEGSKRVDSNYTKFYTAHITIYRFAPESDADAHKIKDNYYILETLKKDYDFIIVNIPPVIDSPDLVFLQRYVNKVILVIEAEKTSSLIVKYNLSLLKEYAFGNISALLNKRRFHIPEVLYRFL